MTIQIDTHEHEQAIVNIKRDFDKAGVQYFRSKMFVGDYMDIDNARFCVDRKQDLLELCKNVCQDHKRFIAELEKAKKYHIHLVFLVEHGEGIQSIEDVRSWINPRLADSKLAVSGERLYKILCRLEKTYNTKFYFCSKQQTGRGIIKLLRMHGRR